MMSLMKGKKGLIMGVANERSIAWGISQKLAEAGAELAFTYLGDALKKRVIPLAEKLNSNVTFSCDVEKKEEVVKLFEDIKSQWGEIDFVVHAVAFSDKSELSGEYLNTTRENFKNSLDISTYSFIEIARRSHPLMIAKGGTLLTLTYQGSNRVTPFYNVMGVAKAALEATTRYLANDLGADGIRVNAISPGPMKTLAGAAIGGARKTFK
ncbi:MAG: SDR family oxidoreductase, partial [Paracoccaceae bacterium]|nr:SDR family oxidoreductase [Paracoccaceae bacterium]